MTQAQLDRDALLIEIQKFVTHVVTVASTNLPNTRKAEMICYLEDVLHTSVMQRINYQRKRLTTETLN